MKIKAKIGGEWKRVLLSLHPDEHSYSGITNPLIESEIVQDIKLVDDECEHDGEVDSWICQKCFKDVRDNKSSTKIYELRIGGDIGVQVAYNREKIREIIKVLNNKERQ